MIQQNSVSEMDGEEGGAIDIGILSELVGYHLRRAGNVTSSDFDQAVGDLGIRQSLFGVLSIIAVNPGINQGTIGQALGIKRANMVALINELVGRKYVDRRTSRHDRRALTLALTDAGKTIFDEAITRIRTHEARILAPLSPSERHDLIRMLKTIASAGNAGDEA